MCGIAAIFNYRDSSPVDRAEMRRMLDRMKRRGPDGEGEWYSVDLTVALGHKRLAIIDLSEQGAQPMASHDGRKIISFNGEIYNFRQLRAELEKKGKTFRSTSDTEVLLHLYDEYGPAMVEHLRGMFTFALWDETKKGLLLARDHFGIKPIYFSDDGKTVRVASQVKALLATGSIDKTPEPAAHAGYFLWGHVPDPYTLYKRIRALPAGCTLWIDAHGPSPVHRYFDLGAMFADAEQSAPDLDLSRDQVRESLRAALLDTVRHHLIADVPVGVFLSAGLDSTTLAALTREVGGDLRSVTLGFNEFRGTSEDESYFAELVARRYGAKHQTIWVTRKDFQKNLFRLLDAMDRPTCDGVNSFFISAAAHEAGLKVALSGLGGDEIFGGYGSFEDVPRAARLFAPFNHLRFLSQTVRRISTPALKYFTSPKYAGLLEYGGTYGGAYLLRRGMFMPWELPGLIDPDMARDGWNELQTLVRLDQSIQKIQSPYLKVSALELQWYMRHQLLRDTDWTSMDHSLEIRTPLVDIDFLRAVAPLMLLKSRPAKKDMAAAARPELPAEILHRRKTGFSVPVREWLVENNFEAPRERGLRGWTRIVYDHFVTEQMGAPSLSAPAKLAARRHPSGTASRASSSRQIIPADFQPPNESEQPRPPAQKKLRVLVLVSDAFGGHGGIAKFNRDFLSAISAYPDLIEVVALPRVAPNAIGPLPEKVTFRKSALGGKRNYLRAIWQTLKGRAEPSSSGNGAHANGELKKFDLVICGHLNLLAPAYLASRWSRAPLLLVVHGVEAWRPPTRFLVKGFLPRVQRFVAVSELTRNRFISWSGLPRQKGFVLPNSVDANRFGPGPKSPALLKRYGLENRKIIMTLGRLASEERYKGFDEIIEVLPDLLLEIPSLAYLIVGDGNDRLRLQEKARKLGLASHVVFAGRISEEEKADHFRLADVYAMPGRGEGFGIVYLEALACGIPVIGSRVDGSREALLNGELGILVDPARPDEVKGAIRDALNLPKGVPRSLEYFSFGNFQGRVHDLLDEVFSA